MARRSTRERLIQTLWFEGVGVALVAPTYAWVTAEGAGESFAMVAAVSLTVMLWAALFNTAFDAVEWRLTQRVASARPTGRRLVHAAAFEITAMAATVPVIYALGDMTCLQALQTDVALTLAYMAYGYAFHCLYDRWRPVCQASTLIDISALVRTTNRNRCHVTRVAVHFDAPRSSCARAAMCSSTLASKAGRAGPEGAARRPKGRARVHERGLRTA